MVLIGLNRGIDPPTGSFWFFNLIKSLTPRKPPHSRKNHHPKRGLAPLSLENTPTGSPHHGSPTAPGGLFVGALGLEVGATPAGAAVGEAKIAKRQLAAINADLIAKSPCRQSSPGHDAQLGAVFLETPHRRASPQERLARK